MISFTCLQPLKIGFLLSSLDMGLSDSIGCKQLETPGVPGLIMVPCFVLGEGCLTNVTSVCVRQGINSFFYVAVVTAVGLGFELLSFLPFPFPWLLSEGERRRAGCRGSIQGELIHICLSSSCLHLCGSVQVAASLPWPWTVAGGCTHSLGFLRCFFLGKGKAGWRQSAGTCLP